MRDVEEKPLGEFADWIIPSRYKTNNGKEYTFLYVFGSGRKFIHDLVGNI